MATQAPEETDILCENCGYMLNGLPPSGNCPECGTTIDTSISERLRQPCPWESIGDPRPKWMRFLTTSGQIIFHPTKFYRHSTSRGQLAPAYQFARIHWVISSLMLGLAAWFHWESENALHSLNMPPWVSPCLLIALPLLVYLALSGTIGLAGRLTTWEAGYRGFRLPPNVVRRALYFHSAHLLPVGLLALATCAGYYLILRLGWLMQASEPGYLYTLSGEVIVSAGYLFNTYWIGMRNWMYANR